MPDDKGKTPVSLRVDTEVVEWFKQQGKGYLTRMNACCAPMSRPKSSTIRD